MKNSEKQITHFQGFRKFSIIKDRSNKYWKVLVERLLNISKAPVEHRLKARGMPTKGKWKSNICHLLLSWQLNAIYFAPQEVCKTILLEMNCFSCDFAPEKTDVKIVTKYRWNFAIKIDSEMTLSEKRCFNGIFAPVKLWLKRFLNAFGTSS